MILYWKLAAFKVAGKALLAGVLSVAATLNGADWTQFTGTQKFLAIAAGLGAMWTVIDAFLDTTMSELRNGLPPAPPPATPPTQ